MQLKPPPRPGSIESDTPLRISSAKLINGEIFVTMEWMPSADGQVLEPTLLPNTVVKDVCPKLLIDYYESKIV